MAKNGMNTSPKKKLSKDVTPEMVLAWAHKQGRIPVAKSAELISQAKGEKVSERTISRYRADMAKFIGQQFDVNDLRNNLFGLYWKAVTALDKLLGEGNPKTVSDYFHGQQIWTNKHEIDTRDLSDRTSDELKSEFSEITGIVARPTEEGDGDSPRTKVPS